MVLPSSSTPWASVRPAPTALPRAQGVARTLYEDNSIDALGTIDTSRTLLARLCGRVDDTAFNAQVITTTRSLHTPAHVTALLYLATVLAVFTVDDGVARTAISYVSCSLGLLLLLYIAASLSWDMLKRLVPTFQFAFLFAVNLFNGVLWTLIFDDARRVVMVVAGACYAASLCADANVHTRHLVTRMLVVTSTALPVLLALVVFQFTPHTSNPPLHLLGDVTIGAVDLQVSGSLIIGFFTTKRVQRAQRLVFSRAPIPQIECDMYLPLCHLVPQAQRHPSQQRVLTAGARQPLLLVDERAGHDIDVAQVLLPRVASATAALGPSLVNAVGLVGVLCCVVAPLLQPNDFSEMPWAAFVVTAVGLLASLGCSLCYVAQYQPALARRVSLDIDAWFVSVHMTLVTICVADVVRWDLTRLLWPCTAWVWCHWVLYLDAVTPQARRRLAFSRRLTLIIIVLLAAYPVVLTFWLYLSPVRPSLQNRVVVVELTLGRRQWLRIDMLGFLASRLFTLWIWTGRFLWRELLRPADAYKLLKRHAAYRVAS